MSELVGSDRSESEVLVEEAERQMSQTHEIKARLEQIRQRLIGSSPEEIAKDPMPPPIGGLFGAIHAALYSTGRNIEGIYDELRPIEKALGIQAEKHPAEPARLGKIGR